MRTGGRWRTTRRALERHPLLPLALDAPWYVTRHRDVFRSGMTAADHFLGPGVREGRDPSAHVDLSFYSTQVPGLQASGTVTLAHLLDTGIPEGLRTSPYIDLAWYRRNGLGVPADPVGALRHLLEIGLPAGAHPGPFVDLTWFSAAYPDITRGGLDAFDYFVALGGPLRRFPHPVWDEDAYVDDNEYVRFALGLGKHLHGYEHFCAIGHAEVARGAETLVVTVDGSSVEYVEERYLRANPDVAEQVERGELASGVEHFFATGHREVAAGGRRMAPASRRATATIESGDVEPQGTSLVVLVHFDVDGIVDEHVLIAIDAYRSAGSDVCAVVVDVNDDAMRVLRERATHIVRRSANDSVRDFGAWHLALSALGDDALARYDRIVLANDSAYFPVTDPTEFLAALREQESDLWAATDSLSGGRYHIQSYFLALSRRALDVLLPEIERRLDLFEDPTKLLLIKRFEIGLTRFALEQGLSVDAFRSVGALGPLREALSPQDHRELSPLGVTITNQSHHFWRSALASGLPFLKVELLRDNPLGLDVSGWEEAVAAAPCSPATIARHLARVRR
jgi:hypothetical protein